MHCIHKQPCSDEWEAMLIIFVETEDLAMLQTHKLHSCIFEKMILLCKMLIINCQTCFNSWGAVNTAVPQSKLWRDSPFLSPHDLRHWQADNHPSPFASDSSIRRPRSKLNSRFYKSCCPIHPPPKRRTCAWF